MYQQGVRAFQQHQFTEAVEAFLAAKHLGLTIPKLHFNLGSSYFKLAQYEQAFAEFQLVADDPQLAVLARINLALCSLKMDQASEAQQYLQSALTMVRSEQSRKQILHLMDKYGFEPQQQHSKMKWASNVNLMLGHTSNVTLTEITDGANADKSDGFAHAVVSTQLSFFRTMRARLDMQTIEYASLNSYDYGSAKFQLGYTATRKAWSLDLATDYQTSSLAHDSFLASYAFHAGINTSPRNHWITALSLDYIQHDEKQAQYAYLSGTQANAQLLIKYQIQSTSIGLQIAGEDNNRQDIYDNETLQSSYSPTRWLIGANFNWQLHASGLLTLAGNYRESRYPAINNNESQRQDQRLTATFSYTNKLYKQLWWMFNANIIDNSSNFEEPFSYNSRTFLLGLSWQS